MQGFVVVGSVRGRRMKLTIEAIVYRCIGAIEGSRRGIKIIGGHGKLEINFLLWWYLNFDEFPL